MIEFACKLCGERLNVPDHFAGRPFKCTKCHIDGVVPERHDRIKFHCKHCGRHLRVPRAYAGKKATCPKCKQALVVPPFKPEPEPTSDSGTVTVVCPMCNEIIHPSKASKGQMIACPNCNGYVQT